MNTGCGGFGREPGTDPGPGWLPRSLQIWSQVIGPCLCLVISSKDSSVQAGLLAHSPTLPMVVAIPRILLRCCLCLELSYYSIHSHIFQLFNDYSTSRSLPDHISFLPTGSVCHFLRKLPVGALPKCSHRILY